MDNENQVERVFAIKFMTEDDARQFDRFKLLATTKFCSPELLITKWIEDFVKDNEVSFTLLSETDALAKLAEEGLGTSRMSLKKYRDYNVLLDDNGNMFWYTDGARITYNYDLLREYIKTRRSLGVSRLIQEAEDENS